MGQLGACWALSLNKLTHTMHTHPELLVAKSCKAVKVGAAKAGADIPTSGEAARSLDELVILLAQHWHQVFARLLVKRAKNANQAPSSAFVRGVLSVLATPRHRSCTTSREAERLPPRAINVLI